MGTNYYWDFQACDRCGLSVDPVHICKNLSTWDSKIEWDEESGCYLPTITGVEHWRIWMQVTSAGGVVTEYGEHISTDEFWARVAEVPMEARRRSYDWCFTPEALRYDRTPRVSDVPAKDKYWLDHEGFTFYGGEFS